jgi:hypothetical protein
MKIAYMVCDTPDIAKLTRELSKFKLAVQSTCMYPYATIAGNSYFIVLLMLDSYCNTSYICSNGWQSQC